MRKQAETALKRYLFDAVAPGDPIPKQRKIRRALAREAAKQAHRLGDDSIDGVRVVGD